MKCATKSKTNNYSNSVNVIKLNKDTEQQKWKRQWTTQKKDERIWITTQTQIASETKTIVIELLVSLFIGSTLSSSV